MVTVFLERSDDELSRQALTFARGFGDEVRAIAVDDPYAPAAWAQAIVEEIEQRGPSALVAPGTDRGNEVLAHVAAKLDQPMAANCVSVTPGDPASVLRVRWGGSLLEEALVHGSPLLLTVAPHAVAAEPLTGEITQLTPAADGVHQGTQGRLQGDRQVGHRPDQLADRELSPAHQDRCG